MEHYNINNKEELIELIIRHFYYYDNNNVLVYKTDDIVLNKNNLDDINYPCIAIVYSNYGGVFIDEQEVLIITKEDFNQCDTTINNQ